MFLELHSMVALRNRLGLKTKHFAPLGLGITSAA
jgi:hypothetical protein